MIKIAIANMKGGVGKSTSAMMLADTLSLHHQKRVLIIDCDPQANCSQMVLSYQGLIDAKNARKTITAWVEGLAGQTVSRDLAHPVQASQAICYNKSELTNFDGGFLQGPASEGSLSIWPATPDLRFAELIFDSFHLDGGDVEAPRRALSQELLDAIQKGCEPGDIVIFDCPPGFSTLAQSAIKISDVVISPLNVDRVSLWSLKTFWNQGLIDTLEIPKTVIRRALFTMVRNQGGNEERAKIRASVSEFTHGGRFDTEMPFTVQALKMVHRADLDSRRSFNEKYGRIKREVRALGNEVAELVKTQGLKNVA